MRPNPRHKGALKMHKEKTASGSHSLSVFKFVDYITPQLSSALVCMAQRTGSAHCMHSDCMD